jgi:hypothetical protein
MIVITYILLVCEGDWLAYELRDIVGDYIVFAV